MKLLGVVVLAAFVALFAGTGHAAAQGHSHEDGGHAAGPGETVPLAYRLHRFVHPLGIATYVSLWITFLLGFLKFKCACKGINMRWHYGFAILTLVLASFHAGIVLLI